MIASVLNYHRNVRLGQKRRNSSQATASYGSEAGIGGVEGLRKGSGSKLLMTTLVLPRIIITYESTNASQSSLRRKGLHTCIDTSSPRITAIMSAEAAADIAKLVPKDPKSVTVIRAISNNILIFSAPFARFGRIKVGGRGTVGTNSQSFKLHVSPYTL